MGRYSLNSAATKALMSASQRMWRPHEQMRNDPPYLKSTYEHTIPVGINYDVVIRDHLRTSMLVSLVRATKGSIGTYERIAPNSKHEHDIADAIEIVDAKLRETRRGLAEESGSCIEPTIRQQQKAARIVRLESIRTQLNIDSMSFYELDARLAPGQLLTVEVPLLLIRTYASRYPARQLFGSIHTIQMPNFDDAAYNALRRAILEVRAPYPPVIRHMNYFKISETVGEALDILADLWREQHGL